MTSLHMPTFLVGALRENWLVLCVMFTQSQCGCSMGKTLSYGLSTLVGPKISKKKEKKFDQCREDHHSTPMELLGDSILEQLLNVID